MVTMKKAINYGKKATQMFVLANFVYIGGFVMLANNIIAKLSKSLENQSELEIVLEQERKKLDIDDSTKIRARISENQDEDANAQRMNSNYYKITLSPKYHTISTLKHELYHIADGHCDNLGKIPNSRAGRLKKIFKYLYIYEPQAVLYSMTGIKL